MILPCTAVKLTSLGFLNGIKTFNSGWFFFILIYPKFWGSPTWIVVFQFIDRIVTKSLPI